MERAARELKLVLRVLTIDFGNREISRLGMARLGISFASWCFAIALGVYGFDAHGVVGVGLVAAVRLLPGVGVVREIGDRFYLIERGQVEVLEDGVFRRTEGRGESFGEIALLREVPRTATVRTTEATRLLVLERDHFLIAVTGHRRSQQLAHIVADDRWASQELSATTD